MQHSVEHPMKYMFVKIIIFFLICFTVTDAFHDHAKECCQIGRLQAENSKTCSMTNSANQTNYCRYLTHICCLENLHQYFCEQGLQTALRLLPCNQTKFEVKDSYQICCKCCELGVRAGRDAENCEPVSVLNDKCSQQFADCCKKAKSLNCDVGFEMNDRGRCQDINECLSNPCPKTMQCENTPGSFRCIEGCERGYIWSMKYGQCRDIDECAIYKHNCSFGHRCENMPGSFRCIRERNCGTGYQVDPITQTCVDIDECEQGIDECRPGYICKNTPGTYKCVPQKCALGEKFNAFYGRCEMIQCRTGFNLTSTGKCVDINECAQSPCQFGERCDNTPGSYRCVQTFTCANGLEMKNLQCLDIDECQIGNHTCPPPSICQNTYGSFHCICPNGFVFENGNCIDEDECLRGTSICPINSICKNTPGSYRCECVSGYKMSTERAVCEDVNECEITPNICEHKCINVQGSYYCLCQEGFRLNSDKQTCHDIDECSMIDNLCQYQCENTLGSYQCTCPTGFTMKHKRKCQDIDECQLGIHNCSNEEICINLPGSFRCQHIHCSEGYDRIENNRCQLNSHWCFEHQNQPDLRCTNDKPLKYVYSFLSLPIQLRIPTEIFRIRNRPLNVHQHAEYEFFFTNESSSRQLIENKFQLKMSSSNTAHLVAIEPLDAGEEIHLNVQMKIYTKNFFSSISIMKISVFISQFKF